MESTTCITEVIPPLFQSSWKVEEDLYPKMIEDLVICLRMLGVIDENNKYIINDNKLLNDLVTN